MKQDLIRLAQKMRKEPTEAERILWNSLCSKKFLGYKFRRQHIFGRYIVDFVAIQLKLIIELDGSYHADQLEDDRNRTEYLNSLGFKVIRFKNNLVISNVNSVLEHLYQSIDIS